jgi:AraC family transcriptional regulator of adaptative response/methylated-DNA-[protein]-cysteine methyltransferase
LRKIRLVFVAGDEHNFETMSDYDRIAEAIDFIVANSASQPGLAEVAARAHLSPFHFQRLFSRWTGVTPKRFLQVVTVERAKQLLERGRISLLQTSESLGLSSTSRLHDHFVSLEAVTPAEFRRKGRGVTIRYGEADSPFGKVFVAATERGLCAMSFVDHDTEEAAVARLERSWPEAHLFADAVEARRLASHVFRRGTPDAAPVSLAVRGTNFQIAVWRALLRIPPASLVTYGDLARAIGRPKAARAVGAAVGANPCAFVIPCHRVIRQSGEMGGYRWGLTRKHAINAWESAASDGMLAEA